MTKPVSDFFAELEEERERQGLKQSHLSVKALGNKQWYSDILRDNRTPTVHTMAKLADALDMNLIICLGDRE